MLELSGLSGDRARVQVAGDTYNTAVYLARAGVNVRFATAVGADAFSQRIISSSRNEGIETDLVITLSDRTVGIYAVEVDDRGERTFTYWRSESAARQMLNGPHGAVLAQKMEAAGLLYVSGITLSVIGGEGRERLYRVAEKVTQSGGKVAFDTNYRPSLWETAVSARDAIERLAPFVSVALPAFDDDRALYGDACAEETAERWLNVGVDEVVVKCGMKGAYVLGDGWVKPDKVLQPVDATGAGDSFNAAYLAARLKGADPVEAAMSAHALAGQVVMVHGAILPKRAD